ncbi:MAG: hypothetical protein ACRDVD_03260 [Acidimicrobiia bacterium]
MGEVWAALRTRPLLATEALSAAWAFRRRGGILPARALVQWRRATAYGSRSLPAQSEDLIRYLEWRRELRRTL